MKNQNLLVSIAVAAVLVLYLEREGLQRWLAGDRRARVAAAELKAALEANPFVLGPVAVEEVRVTLFGGQMTLSVRDESSVNNREGTTHLHVVANTPLSPDGDLGACIFGLGASHDEATSSAVSFYRDFAFPPVLASFTNEAVPGAAPFSGSEEWGVANRRGFAGPVAIRWVKTVPAKAEEFHDHFEAEPLFASAGSFPMDGRLHLLKAVLDGTKSDWARTLELDGKPTQVTAEPWTRKGAPPAGAALVVRFAVFQGTDRRGDGGARVQALARLSAGAKWLPDQDVCPNTLLPSTFREIGFSRLACLGGRLDDCVNECERGSAGSCYELGLELEDGHKDLSQRIFLHACGLGFASACTNAAAGRLRSAGKNLDPCSLDTVDRVCESAGDPWACTMFGNALATGVGVPANVVRAKKVLGKSCTNGDDDPACQSARAVLRALKD